MPWKTLGGIVGVVGSLLGVYFLFFPEPKDPHSGEITEVRTVEYRSDGILFSVQAHLVGFNDKPCRVAASVRFGTTGTPVPLYGDVDAGAFIPESEDDRASLEAFVPTPTAPGQYYVEFVVYDDDGVTILDRQESASFQVQ